MERSRTLEEKLFEGQRKGLMGDIEKNDGGCDSHMRDYISPLKSTHKG